MVSQFVIAIPTPFSNGGPLKFLLIFHYDFDKYYKDVKYNHNLNNDGNIKSSIKILVDLYIISDNESLQNLLLEIDLNLSTTTLLLQVFVQLQSLV